LEGEVVDVVAAVRGMLQVARDRVRAVLVALGVPLPIEPELDELARHAFRELKESIRFEPSHDLLQAVLEHLRRLEHRPHDGDSRRPGGE
jgi:hypothetical protein